MTPTFPSTQHGACPAACSTACTLGDMLPRCDYLTIHVPYLPTTRHTINAQTLAMCKDGVRVLNFARGELVDNGGPAGRA